jgi:hypothetical protein
LLDQAAVQEEKEAPLPQAADHQGADALGQQAVMDIMQRLEALEMHVTCQLDQLALVHGSRIEAIKVHCSLNGKSMTLTTSCGLHML